MKGCGAAQVYKNLRLPAFTLADIRLISRYQMFRLFVHYAGMQRTLYNCRTRIVQNNKEHLLS